MNDKDKIAWLGRYKANMRETARLRLEIMRWRSLAERTTRSLDSLPGGGGNGDALQQAVESMHLLTEELCQTLEARVALRREIEAAVAEVDKQDMLLGAVLRLRYFDARTWREVGSRLHYSEMQIGRYHKAALRLLRPLGETAVEAAGGALGAEAACGVAGTVSHVDAEADKVVCFPTVAMEEAG